MTDLETNVGLGESGMQPGDFDLFMVTDPDSRQWQSAAGIEASVFIEKNYVKSQAELEEEYEPYLGQSDFLLATSRDFGPVGSVRCIVDGPAGFKTLNDIRVGRLTANPEGQSLVGSVPPEKMLEIGTLAVPAAFRSRDNGRVAAQLYGAIFGYMKPRELTHVIASFDGEYWGNFKGIFGDTVTAIGPPVDYMGSPTVPALMNVYDMHERTRELSQELYDTIQRASERVK